jgi:lysyl-tRNA synthetase class 1
VTADVTTVRANHWAEQLAGDAHVRWASSDRATPIVCASGISPSGPIHMGNLREVFTTHLVADVLRGWGLPVVHLHSWDDYDRLRKVPAGVEPAFEEYVGMPLAEIPDPTGESRSYADHFIGEFTAALDQLGIEIMPVRQAERYRAGAYNGEIRRAMDARAMIFDTLAEQQTPGRGDGAGDRRRRDYYPFKPYCEQCGHDATEVVGYADEVVEYRCHRCGFHGRMSLADGAPIRGKLVWKVDWPMRWKHEGVTFEPAGEDHHAPTGSFTVGRTLVREVFGGEAPLSTVYSFVTLSGVPGKMSGSVGSVVTPEAALEVIEPAIVRWPYVQRQPSQSFQIDLSPRGIQRLYDHWDQFAAGAVEAEARPEQQAVYRMSTETTGGSVRRTARPVSFRLLSSVADLTNANRPQIARIVATHLDEPIASTDALLDELEPRLSCAIRYATEIVPADQRTAVRTSFDEQAWAELDDDTRAGIEMLAAELPAHWSLEGLTVLVYGVPKRLRGLPPDAAPTPELKRAQRDFFKATYRLLCDAETGPRIPTLMLSIGLERTSELLGRPTDRG